MIVRDVDLCILSLGLSMCFQLFSVTRKAYVAHLFRCPNCQKLELQNLLKLNDIQYNKLKAKIQMGIHVKKKVK